MTIIISSILSIVVISLLVSSYQVYNFMNTPMDIEGDDNSFEVIKGSSFNLISNQCFSWNINFFSSIKKI